MLARRTHRVERGFSLIEVTVTLAIIGILTAIALPIYNSYIEDSKVVRAHQELETMARVLIVMKTEGESLPFTTNTLKSILHNRLDKINLDPWSRDYQIHVNGGFIYSQGPNPTLSADDIVVYYEPLLSIHRAQLIDKNGDGSATSGEFLQLTFSKTLRGQNSLTASPTLSQDPSAVGGDLLFSSDVAAGDIAFVSLPLIATGTTYTLTLNKDNIVKLGTTKIGIKRTNVNFQDVLGTPAYGTNLTAFQEQKLLAPVILH